MNKLKKGLMALGIGLYSLFPVQSEREVYIQNTSELEQALQIDSSTEHIRINLANNKYEPSDYIVLDNKSLIGETPLDIFDNMRVSLDYESNTGAILNRHICFRGNSNISNLILDVPERVTPIVFQNAVVKDIHLDNIYIKRNYEYERPTILFFTSNANNISISNSYISSGNHKGISINENIQSGEITLENNIFHNNNIALWGNSTALFNAHNNVFMSKDYNIDVARPPYELDFEDNWWYRPKQSLRDGNDLEYELITSEGEIRDTINVREKSNTQNIDVIPFYNNPFFEIQTAVENWDMY